MKVVDGYDNSVEFANGIKVYAGDAIGRVEEEQLRRLQIRETILSHLERERQLFDKGIKVLSFIFLLMRLSIIKNMTLQDGRGTVFLPGCLKKSIGIL